MKIEVYRSRKEFRWRLVARNGKTLAVSSESYLRKAAMLRIVRKIMKELSNATLVDLTA